MRDFDKYKGLIAATYPVAECEEPPATPLKTKWVDKTHEEIKELLADPAKCEAEGFDWHLEMHKFRQWSKPL